MAISALKEMSGQGKGDPNATFDMFQGMSGMYCEADTHFLLDLEGAE